MVIQATLFKNRPVLLIKDSKPLRNSSPKAYQVRKKHSAFYLIGIIPMDIILPEGIVPKKKMEKKF